MEVGMTEEQMKLMFKLIQLSCAYWHVATLLGPEDRATVEVHAEIKAMELKLLKTAAQEPMEGPVTAPMPFGDSK